MVIKFIRYIHLFEELKNISGYPMFLDGLGVGNSFYVLIITLGMADAHAEIFQQAYRVSIVIT